MFYSPLAGVYRNTQELVEVAGAAQFPVGFVDGVEEVGDDDEGVDGLPMPYELGRAGLRARVASANEKSVEEGLDVPNNLRGDRSQNMRADLGGQDVLWVGTTIR